MARCSLCGNEDLCFTCPYCNGVYCADHRLPEGHGCPGLHLAKERAQKRVTESLDTDTYDASEDFFQRRQRETINRRRARQKRKRFSAQERKDLLISVVLIILVSISLQSRLTGYSALPFIDGFLVIINLILSGYGWFPLAYIGIFLTAFFVHEFAHKFSAQSYGMWAEFRMTMQGYYLSAIAIFLAIPIFGTGTMFTSGAKSLDEEGKVNIAGPLSNFILASILVITSILIQLAAIPLHFTVFFILQGGTILNSFLGLFNMIPIQPFDGGTVIKWNKMIWALLTIALIFTLIFGYIVMPMFPVVFS